MEYLHLCGYIKNRSSDPDRESSEPSVPTTKPSEYPIIKLTIALAAPSEAVFFSSRPENETLKFSNQCQFRVIADTPALFSSETTYDTCELECKKNKNCDVFNFKNAVSTCHLYKSSDVQPGAEYSSSHSCGFFSDRKYEEPKIEPEKITTKQPIAVKLIRDIISGRVWRNF